MPAHTTPEVLHYVGYDDDRGGIISVIHVLAATGRSQCVLGMNPGCVQHRVPLLPVCELPRLTGEEISPLNVLRALRVAWRVCAWLREDRNRIFHGHSRAGLLVALWLYWMNEPRVVVSVHCYGRQRWFYRWAARQLGDRLFWLSPAMRHYYGVAGEGWAQCIPGGVPPARVEASTPVAGRLRLGGVGALVRWKRWDLIIEALAQLPTEERKRVTFQHIGGGTEEHEAALRQLAERHSLAAQVKFCGPEPSSDRLLGEIDALVITSDREPFSIAMLEALAAGVPVITADSGGAVDVIREGINGGLYRSGDAKALAAGLREWLRNPPAWDRAAIRRTTIASTDVAAQWADVYARL